MTGDHVLIYTTETGGTFSVFHPFSQEQYEQAVAEGVIRYQGDRPPGDPPNEIHPRFMALCRVEENFDLPLGRSR